MIRFRQDANKIITYIEPMDIKHSNVLCPRCYSEWRIDRARQPITDWFYHDIIGKNVDDTIKTPCGCYMSVWDVLCTSILVDELISKPVSRINIAGYKTAYSCSGHMQGPRGYLKFLHTHDDLLDYLTNDKYMTNVINVEIELHNIKNNKKVNTTSLYYWNAETKTFKHFQTSKHKNILPLENMTIRLKNDLKLANLQSMLLFRRVLNKVAKWCEQTQLYNANNNFVNKLLSKVK